MIDKRLDAGGAAALSGRAFGMWSDMRGLIAGDTGRMTVRLRGVRRDETERLVVLQGVSALSCGHDPFPHSAQTYSPENRRRNGAVGARSRIPTLMH